MDPVDTVSAARVAPPAAAVVSRAAVAALPLACLACLVVTLVLESGLPAHPAGDELAASRGWGTAGIGLVMGLLAWVVLAHDRRQRFGWALAWFGLFWGLDGVSESYVRLGLVTDEPLPAMTFAVWFLNRFTSLLPVTVMLILLVFPTGRLLPGRWGRVGLVSLLVMVVTCTAYVVAPSENFASDGRLPPGVDPDPTTIRALGDLGALSGLLLFAQLAALAGPLLTPVVRYRRSQGIERDRMRWLLWAVVTMVLIAAVIGLFDLGRLDNVLLFLLVVTAPVAMTIAVVAPRLVDIEQLLGRTLVYGGLAGLLLLGDLLVLTLLTGLVGDALDQRQVVLVVLLVAVLVYAPLRSRLAALVRRATMGGRDDPYDVVAGLASSLEAADEGPGQLAAVAEAVAAAFGIRYVSVEVERGSGERVTATYGERPAHTRTLPITWRDQPVGRLVVPARGLRSRLSRRDEQLLGDLVRQAAAAARSSRLAAEVQESRERLVVAREEERRRIRRDLHDGLGPALGGVVLQIDAARLLVGPDPAAAEAALARTRGHVQDVVADVRRLVHDLRPPTLDDRGLVGALGQQAERLSTGGLQVRVEPVGDLGTLPAAVEVAAYRIAGEALTNVVRHAAATRATVRLEVDADHLVVEVADDGRGIDPAVEAGVGLVSLRERAAELGGRSEVSCPPGGGTVVRACLPLRRSP